MEPLEPIINYLVDPNSGLKQVITEFLNAVIQYEAYQQSGVLPYERSPQRKAYRNGIRSRTLKSRVGEITLEKPQFREFPFESKIQYLIVDATFFKVRSGAQYKTRALLIIVGIREDGLREILGASIAESEDSGNWSTLFRSLKDRGLEGVEMVISDAHKGIQKAVESSFLGASWQYCQVHFSRTVLESISNKDKTEIAEMLKEALDDESKMQDLARGLSEQGYSQAAETIDRFRFDLWNYKAYPKAHWCFRQLNFDPSI